LKTRWPPLCSVLAGSVKSAIIGSNQRAGGLPGPWPLRRRPGAAQMTKTGAAGTLNKAACSSWTDRNNCTVRRCSLFLDALQLWRSCCCTGRKVRRSLFRKLSSRRRSWPASYSRTRPIQPLRFRKLRGDVPLGGLAAVRLGLGRCQAIAPRSFATIEARRVPQSILRPHR